MILRAAAFLALAILPAAAAAQGDAGPAFDFSALQLPPGFLDLTDVEVTTDNDGSVTATARTTLANAVTNVLMSSRKDAAGKRGFLLALRPDHWSLTEMFPALANPALDGLTLSHVTLVIADQDIRAAAEELSPDEYIFYQQVYGSDNFTLVLKPGINLIASIPVEGLPPGHPLLMVMDALGIEKGTVLLQGTLGKSLTMLRGGVSAAALKDLYLRAELPPMHPPGSPEWFHSGQLALELTGAPSVRLVGAMDVAIQEDELQFFLAATLARTGVTLSGGMQAVRPWEQPFGVEWLTLNKVVLQIGITPTGSVQLGFAGDAVIGKKDIDVAVAIALSPPFGVPTNFMMKGESEAGVGVSDLVELQHKMAIARAAADAAADAAAGGTGIDLPPPLPLDALPDIEFRSIGILFAPKDNLDLGIERGFKLKGRMWLPTGPGGALTDFAGVDVGVDNEGFWARGDLGAFQMGPLTWQDAKLDLTATREDQHLIVQGDVQLFAAHEFLDVNINKTSLAFHSVSELYGLFHAQVDATAAFNLRNPAFRVDAVVDNDFGEYVQPILRVGVERFAARGQQTVDRAQTALTAIDQVLANASATATQLRAVLETQRANAEQAWRNAQVAADRARASAASAWAARAAAERLWAGTPLRQVALRAARRADLVRWTTIYATRAAAFSAAQTVADAGRRILDALPPVDQNVLLLAADAAVAALRAQLQTAQTNLTTLSTRLDAVLAAMAAGEDPFRIDHAEIHANLEDLRQGRAVSWKITGVFVGQPFLVERALDFSEPAAAIAQILSDAIGGGAE